MKFCFSYLSHILIVVTNKINIKVSNVSDLVLSALCILSHLIFRYNPLCCKPISYYLKPLKPYMFQNSQFFIFLKANLGHITTRQVLVFQWWNIQIFTLNGINRYSYQFKSSSQMDCEIRFRHQRNCGYFPFLKISEMSNFR